MPRKSKEENKAYYKLYYARNREKVIAKTTEYLNAHPGVVAKIRANLNKSGYLIKYGRADRQKLSDGYLKALISVGKVEKTLEQKKKEVLQFRLKKLISGLDKLIEQKKEYEK